MRKRRLLQEPVMVTIGGWYQRTTLHLSEAFDLFAYGTSELPLSHVTLKQLRKALRVQDVVRVSGALEHVRVSTTTGIVLRYYEDGLYVLEKHGTDVAGLERELSDYLEHALSPAIAYIFSLGAPTPKEVAEIPSQHPFAVVLVAADPTTAVIDERMFGEAYQVIDAQHARLVKTPTHILIIVGEGNEIMARDLLEMQIFFREFKDQLKKYLTIHRTMWEDISALKEQKSVQRRALPALRSRLDEYQVSIGLIDNRINQMSSYIGTRAAVAKRADIEADLRELFAFRFEDLEDTLAYMKEIWRMTAAYVEGAVRVIVEAEAQGTQSSIHSLRAITTFGVLAGMVQFMWEGARITTVTPLSIGVLIVLLFVAWGVDRVVRSRTQKKECTLKFTERAKDISRRRL